ncbi:nicotinamide riboside transporter PnuC [Ferruginibacter sp. SUN002]|uniref:nicotinamide riboside transporter PnuC n=1 Tax=Ferruginibacter sp. SUN002 TaxID=2937789 RepID=UPI003D36B736
MTFPEICQQLIDGIKNTHWLEFTAVIFGIVSVIFSRMENIWVYPTGLVNTVLYTYMCYAWWNLKGEASLNFYYTVMSVYGWWMWSRQKKGSSEKEIHITASNKKEWSMAIGFFLICWLILFFVLKNYTSSNVPIADSFASASAYTAMWLMAKKKLENWTWWIITNVASIPLYFYKHAVFTSFQYLIFLILAVMGYITWRNKIKNNLKKL